jgi:hypothetical protein
MIPDSGLNVSGKFTDVSENGSAFIGLDDGPAGKRFKETVIDSAGAAKNKNRPRSKPVFIYAGVKPTPRASMNPA